jgi:TDG/mug DNA glycosylase family protein
MFWYLLSDAGILKEKRNELRDDEELKRIYREKFNRIYRLGFVNIINRPTRDISALKKGEELPGRRRISRIIKTETPPVVCFIGKISYEKYIGSKDFSFGWQEPINQSKIFVMHFPLRGQAIVRTSELREVLQATLDHKQGSFGSAQHDLHSTQAISSYRK